MISRSPRILLAALCCLLTLATSASAEGAWVLWSRSADPASDGWLEWTTGDSAYPTYSKCWAKIYAYTGIPAEGSLTDWLDWMSSRGRYDQRMLKKDLLHMSEDDTYIGATESGAVVFIGKKRGTEWRCLPDTMDPRGPKGK